MFVDAHQFEQLVAIGNRALQANDTERLRAVVNGLFQIHIGFTDDEEMVAAANIVRG